MKKNTKEKGSEYIGLKECFGTTTLSFTHALKLRYIDDHWGDDYYFAG